MGKPPKWIPLKKDTHTHTRARAVLRLRDMQEKHAQLGLSQAPAPVAKGSSVPPCPNLGASSLAATWLATWMFDLPSS